jgi:ADP-ribose pyrophosphatase YjhB (NUDIX family)
MKFLLRLIYRIYRLHWWITRPFVVGVRIILVQDDKVLLVRHTYQQHWYFPGGAVKRGETLVEAAKREAMEESGVLLLEAPHLLGIYSSFNEGKSDHIAVFACENFQLGKATDRWEIDACQFFSLTTLPADLSPACKRRLEEYQTGDRPYVGNW